MQIKNWLSMILLTSAIAGHAQTKIIDFSVVRVSEWVTQKSDTLDYSLGEYSGSTAFILKRNFGNPKSASLAYPKNLDFKNGLIELDIASPNGTQGFVGIAFHISDSNHYETLYFRPGSSGTNEAIQYMPKKKPEFDWWDYEAASYQANALLPEKDWFHVKLVIRNRELKVYLNNQSVPVMSRSDLDPGLQKGSVGFWLGNSASGAYRNLRIQKED